MNVRTTPGWGNRSRYGEFEVVGAKEGRPRLLGEGSFGKTFEGVRNEVAAGGVILESVAIKVLSPDLLSSESKRYQFIQELLALSKFKHANLIHYIRCGEEEGEVYYAMELCRGGDLAQMVSRFGPLPERVTALIAVQVANGLKEVHVRHRFVHRDIKPSNIMLADALPPELTLKHLGFRVEEQESLCRIVDFGLVDFTQNTDDPAQQRFVGSPMYASPEQIREQPVDGRSDIYSLGMTLWYLVQGKGPLLDSNGDELKDMREAMGRHARPEEFESEFPAFLSPEFRQLLARMVAKRPEQRFTSASELQIALRDYLSRDVSAPVVETKAPITQSPEPLEKSYQIEGTLPTRGGRKSYAATERVSGRNVRLTVVANLGGGEDPNAVETKVRELHDAASLTALPVYPHGLLPLLDVIWATDQLAYTEDFPAHVTLADVLRARASTKRAIGFNEACLIFRPIAEALDFMLQHRREIAYLPVEEVWLSGRRALAAPDDPKVLASPLMEWEELRVFISMMYPAPGSADGLGSGGVLPQQTLSGSMQMSAEEMHPVPVFARLVYRILNGSEVAAATQFTPNAYVPAVTLGAGSNNLIRDLLSRQRPWTNTTDILKSLCEEEGVIWRSSSSTMDSATRTVGGGGGGTFAGASATHSRIPSKKGSANTSIGAATRSTIGSASVSRTVSRASSTQGGSTTQAGRPGGDAAEKTCEVVSPGIVRSPYDPERREQKVASDQWVPSGSVRCAVTGRTFRLPRKLDSLVARVISPGVVQSPYAAPGKTQKVAWDEWMPGGGIVCAESGKRLLLPMELPLPEGLLPSDGAAAVISPYDRKTRIPISPEQWEPGATVLCPTTLWNFVLPAKPTGTAKSTATGAPPAPSPAILILAGLVVLLVLVGGAALAVYKFFPSTMHGQAQTGDKSPEKTTQPEGAATPGAGDSSPKTNQASLQALVIKLKGDYPNTATFMDGDTKLDFIKREGKWRTKRPISSLPLTVTISSPGFDEKTVTVEKPEQLSEAFEVSLPRSTGAVAFVGVPRERGYTASARRISFLKGEENCDMEESDPNSSLDIFRPAKLETGRYRIRLDGEPRAPLCWPDVLTIEKSKISEFKWLAVAGKYAPKLKPSAATTDLSIVISNKMDGSFLRRGKIEQRLVATTINGDGRWTANAEAVEAFAEVKIEIERLKQDYELKIYPKDSHEPLDIITVQRSELPPEP